MSDGTSIEWTEATWNPIRARDSAGTRGWHCERVSPGCQHCYAERLNEKRFGTGLPYNRKSRDKVEVYLDEKALTQPLHWRRPRKVFVCSMTDLFGEWVPDEMIDRVFAVMALSPQHTFQVLTKRPERMRAYMGGQGGLWKQHRLQRVLEQGALLRGLSARVDDTWAVFKSVPGLRWPLPNVWLGTSVEDQERADQRIPELLATPAAVRFVSYEPALGPVDFDHIDCTSESDPGFSALTWTEDDEGTLGDAVLDWIIVGGESGPGARPFDLAWARLVVQQCQAAGVAVFVKQLGAKPYSETRRVVTGSVYPSARAARTYGEEPVILDLRDRKGGDMAEWPEDLRVRELPEVGR